MEASFWRRLWTCHQTEYWMNEYIYIYIYMCVCVCVCVCATLEASLNNYQSNFRRRKPTKTLSSFSNAPILVDCLVNGVNWPLGLWFLVKFLSQFMLHSFNKSFFANCRTCRIFVGHPFSKLMTSDGSSAPVVWNKNLDSLLSAVGVRYRASSVYFPYSFEHVKFFFSQILQQFY